VSTRLGPGFGIGVREAGLTGPSPDLGFGEARVSIPVIAPFLTVTTDALVRTAVAHSCVLCGLAKTPVAHLDEIVI